MTVICGINFNPEITSSYMFELSKKTPKSIRIHGYAAMAADVLPFGQLATPGWVEMHLWWGEGATHAGGRRCAWP